MNVKAQYIGDSAVVWYNGSLGVFRRIGVTTYVEVYDPVTGWTNVPVDFDERVRIEKSPHDTSKEWVEEHSQVMPDAVTMYCELLGECITYKNGMWHGPNGDPVSANQADEITAIYLDIMRYSKEAE